MSPSPVVLVLGVQLFVDAPVRARMFRMLTFDVSQSHGTTKPETAFQCIVNNAPVSPVALLCRSLNMARTSA